MTEIELHSVEQAVAARFNDDNARQQHLKQFQLPRPTGAISKAYAQ